MELPDVKREAHKQIDSLQGTILGMFQIMIDSKDQLAVCIAGIPDVIVEILAKSMSDNHQIKDLFESAWCKVNDAEFNTSMN